MESFFCHTKQGCFINWFLKITDKRFEQGFGVSHSFLNKFRNESRAGWMSLNGKLPKGINWKPNNNNG